MAFVKLDTGILNSSLWIDREAREIFITALLMAVPRELREPAIAYACDSLQPMGWQVPPGWYGLAEAAGVGIVARAGLDLKTGMAALARLCAPDPTSRSPDFEGRRMARIAGGYVVLNYMQYRERDYTGAERAKRYRARRLARSDVTSRRDVTPEHRDVTHADAEADAEKTQDNPPVPPFVADSRPAEPEKPKPAAKLKPPPEWQQVMAEYPRRAGAQPWHRALRAAHARITEGASWAELIDGARRYRAFLEAGDKVGTEYVMQASTFYGPDRHYAQPWELPPTRQRANGHRAAWDRVLAFVRSGEYRRQGATLDPAIDATVRLIGGYALIGQADDFTARQLEARFRDAWP